MNLKQLRYFCAIVENKGLAPAAETLFVAPTAISMQLLQLEGYLGNVLFDRSKRPMELTEFGRFFYAKAKAILQDVNQLDREVKNIVKGKKQWIRIGFTRSMIISILPEAIRKFSQQHANVHLDLVEILSEYQAESLRNDKIDLAISRFIGAYPAEEKLTQHILMQDPFIAAIPKNHPLAAKKSLTMQELAELPLILYPKDTGSQFAQQILAAFKPADVEPKIAYEAIEIHTALALVSAGLGMTLVGETVSRSHLADVAFLPIENCAQSTTLLVSHREHETNPLVADFLRILTQIVAA